MKTDVSLTVVKRTSDILSEMESLMILGGKSDKGDSFIGNCDNYTHCDGAYCGNCVAGCGGSLIKVSASCYHFVKSNIVCGGTIDPSL